MEYQTEKEAFRKQTEAMGIGRKVKRGDAWFPVSVGQSHYNSLNQMTIEILRTQDQDIEHNFEYGKPVMFFTVSQTTSKANAKGSQFERCLMWRATAWWSSSLRVMRSTCKVSTSR